MIFGKRQSLADAETTARAELAALEAFPPLDAKIAWAAALTRAVEQGKFVLVEAMREDGVVGGVNYDCLCR